MEVCVQMGLALSECAQIEIGPYPYSQNSAVLFCLLRNSPKSKGFHSVLFVRIQQDPPVCDLCVSSFLEWKKKAHGHERKQNIDSIHLSFTLMYIHK